MSFNRLKSEAFLPTLPPTLSWWNDLRSKVGDEYKLTDLCLPELFLNIFSD